MSLALFLRILQHFEVGDIFLNLTIFLQFAGLLRVNHTESKEPKYTYLSRYGLKLVYNSVLVKNAPKSNKKFEYVRYFNPLRPNVAIWDIFIRYALLRHNSLRVGNSCISFDDIFVENEIRYLSAFISCL